MPSQTNLINLFDFYLAFMFAIGLWRRRRIYANAIRLTLSTIGKRRKLVGRLGQHKNVLLKRDVLLPFVIVSSLTVVQWICSRLIWPQASVTIEQATTTWRGLVLLLAFLPMASVDVYFLVRIASFDHGETAKYLDQAENWLGWRGPAVRVITLGFVSPKRIVDAEVRKSLDSLSRSASWAMWWTCVQSTLRVTFGLTVWAMWVFFRG